MPRSTSRGRGKSPAGRDKNASRGKVPAGAAAPTSTSDRQSFLAWCLFCGVLVAATVSLSVSLPLTPVSRVELERIWLCCLGLSLPHLWYTWLWRSPHLQGVPALETKRCGQKPLAPQLHGGIVVVDTATERLAVLEDNVCARAYGFVLGSRDVAELRKPCLQPKWCGLFNERCRNNN